MTSTTLISAVARAAGDDGTVTPGVLGFLVVALLGVATYLLIRSMNRQIKRIDLPSADEMPADEKPPDETTPDQTPPVETPPDEPVSGGPDRP